MVRAALIVRLQAQQGKEADVEQLLQDGLALVNQEAGTVVWMALRTGASSFAVFNAFANDDDRNTHLGGPAMRTLFASARSLLTEAPHVEMIDVVVAKHPLQGDCAEPKTSFLRSLLRAFGRLPRLVNHQP